MNPLPHLHRLRRLAPACHCLLRTLGRYNASRGPQAAAALSFVFLFALVPLILLVHQLVEWLPDSMRFDGALSSFLSGVLLPEEAAGTVTRYASRFAAKARRLTSFETLLLIGASVLLMRTLDQAVNAFWHTARRRGRAAALLLYAALPAVLPLVLGLSVWVSLYFVTASLGWVDEPRWLQAVLLRLASWATLVLFLGLCYWALPNCRVSARAALVGALLATVALAATHKVFGFYVGSLRTYTVVYGSLAILSVFLLWLYSLWSVLLFGAALSAELARGRAGAQTG